jgi:hypothetical protein
VEFESTVAANGQIALPPEVAREIPPGEQLRVPLQARIFRRTGQLGQGGIGRGETGDDDGLFYHPADGLTVQKVGSGARWGRLYS